MHPSMRGFKFRYTRSHRQQGPAKLNTHPRQEPFVPWPGLMSSDIDWLGPEGDGCCLKVVTGSQVNSAPARGWEQGAFLSFCTFHIFNHTSPPPPFFSGILVASWYFCIYIEYNLKEEPSWKEFHWLLKVFNNCSVRWDPERGWREILSTTQHKNYMTQECDKVCTLSLVRLSTFSHQESFLAKTQEEASGPAAAAGWGRQVTTLLAVAVRAEWE